MEIKREGETGRRKRERERSAAEESRHTRLEMPEETAGSQRAQPSAESPAGPRRNIPLEVQLSRGQYPSRRDGREPLRSAVPVARSNRVSGALPQAQTPTAGPATECAIDQTYWTQTHLIVHLYADLCRVIDEGRVMAGDDGMGGGC